MWCVGLTATRFAARLGGLATVLIDHKLLFRRVGTADEAHYLEAIVNATPMAMTEPPSLVAHAATERDADARSCSLSRLAGKRWSLIVRLQLGTV